MVKHMRFSYDSVLSMPVWERRIYIDLWQKELEDQKKEYERIKSKSKR
jgi:hypothetical protein